MSEHPYGWLSLLPPFIAIALAIITRRVVISLLTGILVGGLILSRGRILEAIGDTVQLHLWGTLLDEGRLSVFAFTSLMGAMVGIINCGGGMRGLVNLVSGWANNRRRGQITVWLLGLVVFFDDYANTLLLGNTLRSLTDRLRISREKLAYVVDSTAAPVAGLALVSTWVAIEIEFIQNGLDDLPLNEKWNAFTVFVQTIPYRFYVLWALAFVLLVGLTGRDFGPMVDAERRAIEGDGATTGQNSMSDPTAPDEHVKPRWYNAVGPIVVTVGVMIWFLYDTGRNALGPETPASLMVIFGNADAYQALLWGALCGTLTAGLLAWLQRLLSLDQITAAAGTGARLVFPALVILWFASALSTMTGNSPTPDDALRRETASTMVQSLVAAGQSEQIQRVLEQTDFSEENIESALISANLLPPSETTSFPNARYRLYTGEFLGSLLKPRLWAPLLPTVVFVLSALVAFATGTSWGTMGILMPLTIPLAYAVLHTETDPLTGDEPVFLCTVASVLAGAIFGDHCSPISDTTVLSSQASGCDHVAHVWTQLPYALVVGAVSVLIGTFPIGLGVPIWALLPIGLVLLGTALFVFGTKTG